MGIKQLYNDTLLKLPNEYGDVSVMSSNLKVNKTLFSLIAENLQLHAFLLARSHH